MAGTARGGATPGDATPTYLHTDPARNQAPAPLPAPAPVMTIAFDDFMDLKRRVETFRANRDRAAGRMAAAVDRLVAEHDLPDADAARAHLEKLKDKEYKWAARYDEEMTAFVAEFGDRL